MDTVKSLKIPQPIENKDETQWTEIIKPHNSLFNLRLDELWRYRDLVLMFVRRNFVSGYKQTILGPLWFVLQPLLTTATYVIVFGNVAKLSTDGLPKILFYLAGITIWNYFAETLNKTATVFRDNTHMFGKVYFPRLTMPFSIVISGLVRFCVQFILFIAVWIYYLFTSDTIHPNYFILLTPVLVVLMGLLALGLGMIISSMTTKYRDLSFLLTFGVQLLMYATPIIYPLSSVPQKYTWILLLNPVAPIVETFRFAYLGSGSFSWMYLGYSAAITIIILVLGTIIFNKVEKNFTDTV